MATQSKSPFFKDYGNDKKDLNYPQSPLLNADKRQNASTVIQIPLSKQTKRTKMSILPNAFKGNTTNHGTTVKYGAISDVQTTNGSFHSAHNSDTSFPIRKDHFSKANPSSTTSTTTMKSHKKAFSKHNPTIALEYFDSKSIIFVLFLPLVITILLYYFHASFRYDTWSIDFNKCKENEYLINTIDHTSMHCIQQENILHIFLDNKLNNLYKWNNFLRSEIIITSYHNDDNKQQILLPNDINMMVSMTLPSNETWQTTIQPETIMNNNHILWTVSNNNVTSSHKSQSDKTVLQQMKISLPYITWQTFLLPYSGSSTHSSGRNTTTTTQSPPHKQPSHHKEPVLSISDLQNKQIQSQLLSSLLLSSPLRLAISFPPSMNSNTTTNNTNIALQQAKENNLSMMIQGYSYSNNYAIIIAIETIVLIVILLVTVYYFMLACYRYSLFIYHQLLSSSSSHAYKLSSMLSSSSFILPEQYYLMGIIISCIGNWNVIGSITYLWLIYHQFYSPQEQQQGIEGVVEGGQSMFSNYIWFIMMLLQSYAKYSLFICILCIIQGLRFNENQYEEKHFISNLYDDQNTTTSTIGRLAMIPEDEEEQEEVQVQESTHLLLPHLHHKHHIHHNHHNHHNHHDSHKEELTTMIHHIFSLYQLKSHPMSSQYIDFMGYKVVAYVISLVMITLYWYHYFYTTHTVGNNKNDDNEWLLLLSILSYWIAIQNILWCIYIIKGFWETGNILRHIRYMQSRIRQIAYRILFNQVWIGCMACICYTCYVYYSQQATYFFPTASTTSSTSSTTSSTSSSWYHIALQYYRFLSYWVEYYGIMTTTLYTIPSNVFLMIPNEVLSYFTMMCLCMMYCYYPSFPNNINNKRKSMFSSTSSSSSSSFWWLKNHKKMMIVFEDEYEQHPHPHPPCSTPIDDNSHLNHYDHHEHPSILHLLTMEGYVNNQYDEPFCLELACYLLEVSYQTYFPLQQPSPLPSPSLYSAYHNPWDDNDSNSGNKKVFIDIEQQANTNNTIIMDPEIASVSSSSTTNTTSATTTGPTLNLPSMGLSLHATFHCPMHNIFGLLSESSTAIIIAFRGSTSLDNLSTDFMFTQISLPITTLQRSKDYFIHIFNNSYTYDTLHTPVTTLHSPLNPSNTTFNAAYTPHTTSQEGGFSWMACWEESLSLLTTIPLINQTLPRIHIGFWKAYESIRNQYMYTICLLLQDKIATYFASSSFGNNHGNSGSGSDRDSSDSSSNNNTTAQQHQHNLMEILKKKIFYQTIHFAGHSLGAALASLASLELSLNIELILMILIEKYCPFLYPTTTTAVSSSLSSSNIPSTFIHTILPRIDLYTYGSPRIGNSIFAKLMNKLIPNTFRIQVDGDLITMIPKFLGFYRHFGKLIVLEEPPQDERRMMIGTTGNNILIEPNFIEYSFFRRMIGNLQNHSLEKYRISLELSFDADEYHEYLVREMKRGGGGGERGGGIRK